MVERLLMIRLGPLAVVMMVLVTLTALTACGAGRTPIYQLSPDQLLERGMTDYQEERYRSAIQAFERLLLDSPHHPRVEEIRYYLAMSHMGNEEFIAAAEEFQRLSQDFPGGMYAEEARFRVCESYKHLSPHVQLDQEYTRAAIDHCLALVRNYPGSRFVEQAWQVVEEMEAKLAEKIVVGGKYYYRRGAYDSAIIYFQEALRRYPNAPVAPKALLRLVKSFIEIDDMEEAQAARDRLLREHPDTPEAKEARELAVGSLAAKWYPRPWQGTALEAGELVVGSR